MSTLACTRSFACSMRSVSIRPPPGYRVVRPMLGAPVALQDRCSEDGRRIYGLIGIGFKTPVEVAHNSRLLRAGYEPVESGMAAAGSKSQHRPAGRGRLAHHIGRIG